MKDSSRRRGSGFETTRWSLVLAAGRRSSPESQRALSALCETYWYPLYVYVRRRGHDADEAQDLTQEFFAHLLEKDALRVADSGRGKFRSFLLASLKNFLTNEWRRRHAQKRGGQQRVLSLDFQSGESRYRLEPSHDLTPEKIYQRRWALTLIERAMARLRTEMADRGKRRVFEQLRPFLGGRQTSAPYQEIAGTLEMTEGAVKVAVHRMRRRCREILRAEIAQTVGRPEEVDEELRDLMTAVGG